MRAGSSGNGLGRTLASLAHLRPAPVLYFRGTKKGLVLSQTNQDALQALFGDDVGGCFGRKVLLDPTPMRVAGRELTVIRLKAAPGGNGAGPKPAPVEQPEDEPEEAMRSGS